MYMHTGDHVAADAVLDFHSVSIDGRNVLILYDLVGDRTGVQSYVLGEPPAEHPIRVAD